MTVDPAEVSVVALDLDGTLVDLDVDWAAVREELAAVARTSGVSVPDTGIGAIMRAGTDAGGDGTLAARLEATLARAEVQGAHGSLNAALVEWLDGPAAGLPVSVLSLNCHEAVSRALAHHRLDERIGLVLGRDDLERPKPDPEGLRRIAEHHGVDTSRVLFVGDADTDRECARAAGARFAHVAELGLRWVD